MICAHCKSRDVNVAHVKVCSTHEQAVRSVGSPVHFYGDGAPEARAEAAKPAAVKTLAEEPEEGVYLGRTGEFFKVLQSQTGNWYAKVYIEATEAWEYAGRKPLHSLTADNALSAEQAAAFGHLTGTCVFCARRLTDERSIAVGYGSTCAGHHGLPWGEVV